jgi:predicted flap endonuclease-1-like 5' DNA nuclease
MFRKYITLVGLFIISLGLTAFSGSSRPAVQAGGNSPVIQVLLILGIIILFVLIEWLLLWWLRRGSEAAQVSVPQRKVEMPAPVVKPVPPAPAADAALFAGTSGTGKVEPVAVKAAPLVPDDLKIIEGIGPKISSILAASGITTFAQLAATDVSRLREIIAQAGLTALADPTSWPQQAALAAAGKLDELEALQGRLKGGRRVS